jgi:transposase-like protein
MSVLSAPHFHNEEAAYAYVEERLWPNGPVCPHCGGVERIGKMGGKSTRIGAYKCYQCRKPFTVKVGTVFEASHVPLRHWLQVMFLMASSKKGISTNQIQRTLDCHMKTAWFVGHRLREAMRDGELAPFGGGGGSVEVDETYLWTDPDAKPTSTGNRGGGGYHKMKVLTLIDRDTRRARSFVVDSLQASEIAPILSANIAKEARLVTDQATIYVGHGRMFADHKSVNHAKGEYVSRTDPTVHTNTVEGFYGVFKRGMRGVYQHCAKKHLHRYAAEFDFRYSNRVALGVNDVERADRMLKGAVGKRLTYRPTDSGATSVA